LKSKVEEEEMQATAVTLCELIGVWQGIYPVAGRLAPGPKTGELCGADSEFGNGSDRVTVRLAMGAACRRTQCGMPMAFR
jgi:hypothetical protein